MIPPVVTALVLVREGDDPATVRAVLDALAHQERRPDHTLVVALGPDALDLPDAPGLADASDADAVGTATSPGPDLAAATATVLETLDAEREDEENDACAVSWLWFVPAASVPGRGALGAQLAAIEADEAVAVVGAKRRCRRPLHEDAGQEAEDLPQPPVPGRTADDADGLVDVGITLTHGARIVSSAGAGEIDQGQADWRRDVLAVGIEALLVEESLLRRLGSFDPALDDRWAPIELCHRVWRAGRRVEVVAAARALEQEHAAPATAPEGDERSARARTDSARFRSHRSGQLSTRLATRPLLAALVTLLLLPVVTLARMAGAVVTHRPRRVLDELAAAWRAVRRAPGVMVRSGRASRRARVPRRSLAPLYLSRRQTVRRDLGAAWTALIADDERSRRIRRTTWGIAGTSHGTRDADYGRHTAWTLAVAVAACALTLVALRPLLRAGDLSGPGLLPLPSQWRETWQAAWSDWIPGGLGARGPADPLVRVLAHLPLGGDVLVEILVLGALPLSALGAWWAAGALTRAVGARLVLSAAWALAPSSLAALAEGRWPLLLVHVLLPPFALAVARAVGLPHKRSQASVSAAAAAGLLLLVLGAVQAVLVLLAAVALVLVALAVPGRRLRLGWVLLPSLALHAPFVPAYVGSPRTLLAVGGQSGAPASVPPHEALLALWPSAPPSWTVLDGLLGADAAALAPLLVLAPIALAALVAPFLAASAGRVGRLGLVLAALALALAALSGHVAVGVTGTRSVPAPPHALLSAALLAVLLAAGCSFDALARRDEGVGTARRVLTVTAAVVFAATTAVSVAGWALALGPSLQITRGAADEIPAAAADTGRDAARQRTLVLGGADVDDSAQAVPVRLVVGGGDSVLEHSAFEEARRVDAVEGGGTPDDDPASRALLAASGGLIAGDADADALRTLAVSYVTVPGAPDEHPALVTALDSSPLLEKVTANSTGSLWRVIDQRPRAALSGEEEDDVLIASDVVDAQGRIAPDPDAPRVVVLSERASDAWSAHLDGRRLETLSVDGWAQGFVIPAGASGTLEIAAPDPWRTAEQVALYAAVVLTALIAVPWRGRAPRTGRTT
ncbi:hypothetical protein BRM3_08585 [Brachybacterium huguangmaarense]|uniref:Glycosyl transferase n=1 Tax=Brachybacterium huguangmaarense TaxID=1652028 RepID=A0ABY6FYB2_9MICO|nr:hypothetical protein [Brachybacterium huguangmaarense]UYG15699.1 hypothetical protein BRM3_08585 [Brachybacterium huguangmaarense]